MAGHELILRKMVVSISGIIYWGGVYINALRVRGRTGKSPNLKPSGLKEYVLWSLWAIIITVWIIQPLFINPESGSGLLPLLPMLSSISSAGTGMLLLILGYGGTIWCYVSMGDTWRIGIDKNEHPPLIQKGPYRYVRHPIYLFQLVMLLGVTMLLPTVISLLILIIHLISINIKSHDEEVFLLTIHGDKYRDYQLRTGKFLPRIVLHRHSGK